MRNLVLLIPFVCLLSTPLLAGEPSVCSAKAAATAETPKLQTNGLYIAKTKEIETAITIMSIYTYVRFYNDGTVLTQTVGSYDPVSVAKWFHLDDRFERKGTVEQEGSTIRATVSNEESKDKGREGPKEDTLSGEIVEEGKLQLTIQYQSGETAEALFEFVAFEE